MEQYILSEIAKSWSKKDSNINSTESIINWIKKRNDELSVDINKVKLSDSGYWYYNESNGCIENKNQSFFKICGLKEEYILGNKIEYTEQPVIIQNEIGYLGIICKMINGVIHFLMQAKIEPGNINKVQISPTIQATKSNFTQKHGGNRPPYINYFINANKYDIAVDQIQSEQSSRFHKKRNRNILLYIEDEIEILESHKWMTLGQIKELMKIDNLVNMDTRTVLSCIPFYQISGDVEKYFHDKELFSSIVNDDALMLPYVYNKINDIKMHSEVKASLVKLDELKAWNINDYEIVCKNPYPYKVIFCDIAIEGREVKRWTQPLFEAIGNAVFGLFVRNRNGRKEFLIKIRHEIGCFDNVELGPSVQLEAVNDSNFDAVETKFLEMLNKHQGIIFDHYLSEEGGRFYHEQNRNVLIVLDEMDDIGLPEEYMWLDYKTLNILVQSNNVLNIQLRNLLSLLEV